MATYTVAWIDESAKERGRETGGMTFLEARDRADALNAVTPQVPGKRFYFPWAEEVPFEPA